MSFIHKYKAIIIVGFVSIVIISALLFLTLYKNNNTEQVQQGTEDSQPADEPINPFPQPQFSEWIESDKLIFAKATPKTNSNRYQFKTEFTESEIIRLATLFKATEEATQSGEFHLHTSITENQAVFLFNDTNGSITYISNEGIPLSTDAEASTEEAIFDFLSIVGIYDNSLRIIATYKNTDMPDVTFYEIHRDWDIIGYPILNPIGILNIQEEDLLHELSFFFKDDQLFPDPSIIETSDGKDGFARLNDFNTITIGIDQNTGNIVSLNSNIRPLLINSAYSASQLLTREEALQELNDGNYNFFISEPSGDGSVLDSKVYPDNKAIAQTAIVNEVMLVYLERPPQMKQESLEPYYIFRGYSELDSGYRINFYAAVSAIKGLSNNELSFTTNSPVVAAAVTQIPDDSSQKQGTLDFPTAAPTIPPTHTPVPTITQTLPTSVPTARPTTIVTTRPSTTTVPPTSRPSVTRKPTSTPGPTITLRCAGSTKNLVNVTTFEGAKFGKDPATGNWYFIHDEGTTFQDIVSRLTEYIGLFRRFMSNISNLVRQDEWVEQELLKALQSNSDECSTRISGVSPSLFIYGTEGSEFMIDVDHAITYSEPPQTESWHTKIVQNGLSVNNLARSYIYYEYEAIAFNKPQEGWILRTNDIELFSKKLSHKLQLTPAEEKRLRDEISIALAGHIVETIFVGIIPEEEIHTKLPLIVNPEITNQRRIHLYISAAENKTVKAPVVYPIDRTEEMILELGAVFMQ